jgi:predicted transcriptional regulator
MTSSEAAKDWTFLSNHGHVLVQINRDPHIRIRDLAQEVGITERRAQAIIADLAESGYITIHKSGRQNYYEVNAKLKFRHPREAGKPISHLLSIFK